MIKSFQDKSLEKCWRVGDCSKISAELRRRLLMKLDSMDAATCLDDLRSPPSNKLHPLSGDYKDYWALCVNGPWRLIFRYEQGDIVGIELQQYH